MERLPHSKYTKELRLEAVRLVTEGGLSVHEASMRLSLPKSTIESWPRAFKTRKLERIGSNQRPLTEMEVELARVKRELALVRMERDILKKLPRPFIAGADAIAIAKQKVADLKAQIEAYSDLSAAMAYSGV